jgi:hypothetical protein
MPYVNSGRFPILAMRPARPYGTGLFKLGYTKSGKPPNSEVKSWGEKTTISF